MIVDDEKFTEATTYFANAKFYLKANDTNDVNDLLPSVSRTRDPNTSDLIVHSTLNKEKQVTSQRVQSTSIPSSSDKPTVLHYIPKSKGKEEQLPSVKHEALKILTFPVAKLDTVKRSQSLEEFVHPLEELKVEHNALPS